MWHEIEGRATVPALLTSAVERFGDREFLITAGDRLSYRDADEQSALLACQLIANGAGKGTRIGIVLPSGIEFGLAFLAVARIGAIAMLFSSTYKPAELSRVLRAGDVDTLIAPEVLLGRPYAPTLEAAIDGLAHHVSSPLRLASMPYLRSIVLVGPSSGPQPSWATRFDDADAPAVERSLLDAIEHEVTPSDALLSICTSGSSAEPKLVLHTHGVAVRKVHPSTGLGLQPSQPDERVLVAMPFFWVGGPQVMLGSMHSGSPIVALERLDVDDALELVGRERITLIAGWPALIESLRRDPRAVHHDLSSLKAYPSSLIRSSRGDPVNLGMTETFGPHHNLEIFDYAIIDPETGKPLPEGEVGEFCVRGLGMMLGIYKREREDNSDCDGWYHTGDRGYIEAGRVFFVGRYSEMLKSSGANVAPAEVEQTLLGFDGVAEAYVVGVPNPSLGDEVVAVVVPTAGAELDPATLTAQAKQELSSYKVPRRFIVVTADEVPRLVTGKPDKRSLADWCGSEAAAGR